MANKATRELRCEADTNTLAQEIGAGLRGGMVIGLCGELGAGKTTFTRALVAALGSDDQVSSPTYVLEHKYQTSSGLRIEHWDLYRLSQLPDELLEPPASDCLRVIEWADKFDFELGSVDLNIRFDFDSTLTSRRAIIESHGC